MLWNTPLNARAARGIAWDGQEDWKTGLGGHVWLGTCTHDKGQDYLFKLNGDTGEIMERIEISGCVYGRAVDGTSEVAKGISIDYEGYVWIVSQDDNAAFKFDPDTGTYITVPVGKAPYTYSDMTGVQLTNQVPIEIQ